MADIDPVSRDFARTLRGDLVRAPKAATAQQVWLRLMTERGSLLGDLSYGSLLHSLPQQTMRAGIEEVAMAYARDALAPLVDAGRLRELELSAVRVDRSRLELALRAVAADGTPVVFSEFVRI